VAYGRLFIDVAEVAKSFEPTEEWESALIVIIDTEIPVGMDRVRLRNIRGSAIKERYFIIPTMRLTPRTLSETLLLDPLIGEPSNRRDWAESLAGWQFGFPGYFRSYIDLIFEKNGRWYAADDKTNMLLSYDAASIEACMLDQHYLLQSRIYCVALHRHLQQNLVNYDPDIHFGGVLFLFVRGMPVEGTWFERPLSATLKCLSDLFTPRLGNDHPENRYWRTKTIQVRRIIVCFMAHRRTELACRHETCRIWIPIHSDSRD
jgi:hypothetical protein